MCVVISLFFFVKQKTAYEMLRSLVGSEMCIRDRCILVCPTGALSEVDSTRKVWEALGNPKKHVVVQLSLIHI